MYIDFLELDRREDQNRETTSDVDDIVYREIGFHLFLSSFNDIEILVTLSNREGRSPWEELVTENLG